MDTISTYFDESRSSTSVAEVRCTIIDDPTFDEFIKAFERKFKDHKQEYEESTTDSEEEEKPKKKKKQA